MFRSGRMSGQQLSADIELLDLSSADLANLQVRLASPDVFAGARVTMNPALAGLNMSVYKDGSRRVLHLTTLQPVNAELVHIFFELSSGGRQIVRTASLWLTRETVPARTAIAAAPAVPAALVAPAASAASAAPSVAATVPAASLSAPAVASPTVARAPVSPASRLLAAPQQQATPSRPSPDEEMMKAAAERAFAARRPALASPTAAPVARPIAPAAVQPAKLAMAPARPAEACSPALIEARAQQCAAMDASNKELTTKLVDLEGKVKRLQSAMVAAPASTPAQATSSPFAAKPGAAQKTEPAREPVMPDKTAATQTASGAITDARARAPDKPAEPAKKPEEARHTKDARPAAASAAPEEKPKKMSRPRLISLIAGGALGLLALMGATVHLVRKRRAKGGPLKIWQSFRRKDKAESPVEPTMSEATESAFEATS
ncbi:hypothetical protein ACHMW6_07750 [Pseudoduganella sp. UC29_106]|uniref:FimV/HubP-related protein n=1 Tax=Pseudoduganella sp. UC29_106 TaxID=3374553 RepID=UPI003757B439